MRGAGTGPVRGAGTPEDKCEELAQNAPGCECALETLCVSPRNMPDWSHAPHVQYRELALVQNLASANHPKKMFLRMPL